MQLTANPGKIKILPQPTDESCGPTCLQAVYNYYGDNIDLDRIIKEVPSLKGGGTLAVMLGNHALKRGYSATIYTYNLQVFDPTWFRNETDLQEKLIRQVEIKTSRKLKQATGAYMKFLKLGGDIQFCELNRTLLTDILNKNVPILAGLSATYLYRSAREIPETNQYDDIKGIPVGHFVVICGYDERTGQYFLADPLNPNPIKDSDQYYQVDNERLINAILLGIVTYDANLLVINR